MDPSAVPAPLTDALLAAGYRIGGPAGIGGGGPVWTASRAGDAGAGERVVVALVDLPDDDARARLATRIAALTALDHPHLPRVVDVVPVPLPGSGPGPGRPDAARGAGRCAVLVAEVPGATVAALLAARGRLSAGEVVTLTVPLAGALDAMHRAGLVHGDVSPANVVVRPDGRPVLIDVLGGPGSGAPGARRRGTPGFAAPELSAPRRAGGREAAAARASGADRPAARGAVDPGSEDGGGLPVDAPADVHALAAVALAALDLSAHAGRLGDELRAACAVDPVRRPTAAELAGAVYACAEPEPIEQPDAGVLARTALAQLAEPSRTLSVRSGGRHRAGHRRRPGGRRLAGAALVAAVAVPGAAWALASGPADLPRATAPEAAAVAQPATRESLDGVPAAGDASGGPAPRGDPDERVPRDDRDGRVPREGADGRVPRDGADGWAPRDGADGWAPRDGAEGAAPSGGAEGWAPPEGAAEPVPAAAPARPDVVEAAVTLTVRRARVLAAGDPARLAEVAVPGSPAHRADADLLARLAGDGVDLHGLRARVVGAWAVGGSGGHVPEGAEPAGVAEVRVRSGLGPHVRRSPSGTTRVPAGPLRTVVLRLAWTDAGWRVVAVRPG